MVEKKDILKQISSKETSKNFSNKVMQDIYAFENEKLLSKAILVNAQLESNQDFTLSVMEEIEANKPKKKSIPIFSFWQKMFISIGIISLFIFSMFSKSESKSLTPFDYSILDLTKYINPNLMGIASILSMCILCISILLAIDYYVKTIKRAV